MSNGLFSPPGIHALKVVWKNSKGSWPLKTCSDYLKRFLLWDLAKEATSGYKTG